MKCKLELKGFEQPKNSGDQAEIRKLIEREMSSLDKGGKCNSLDLMSIGRIYGQTFLDTYSKVAFVKRDCNENCVNGRSHSRSE